MTNARRKEAPLGDRFRDARHKADDVSRQQQGAEERLHQLKMKQALSNWFNTIATELPGKVESLVKQMEKGEWTDSRFTFRLSDGGDQSFRGLDDVDIEGLAGFKKASKAARDLNIETEVHVTVEPVNGESFTNYHAISVTFDALEPYKPVPVSRPRK